jgi:two-component system, cell cycle response regulator
MQDNWEAITATAENRSLFSGALGKQAQLIQLTGADVGALYKLVGTHIIGRASDADLRIQGNGISRHHARVTIDADGVEFEDLGSTNGSFINGERVERRALETGDKIQLGSATILRFGFQDMIDTDFQRLMFESASRDMLTELCNKRFFMERLSTEFAFAVRHKTPLSLIEFTIDDFRGLQAAVGPSAANSVLSTMAKAVVSIIRGEDVLAHCGGGEFAILSRGIDASAALAISERVREHVARMSFEVEGQRPSITLCLGLAGLPHADTQSHRALIARADRALAAAQTQGPNTLIVAD